MLILTIAARSQDIAILILVVINRCDSTIVQCKRLCLVRGIIPLHSWRVLQCHRRNNTDTRIVMRILRLKAITYNVISKVNLGATVDRCIRRFHIFFVNRRKCICFQIIVSRLSKLSIRGASLYIERQHLIIVIGHFAGVDKLQPVFIKCCIVGIDIKAQTVNLIIIRRGQTILLILRNTIILIAQEELVICHLIANRFLEIIFRFSFFRVSFNRPAANIAFRPDRIVQPADRHRVVQLNQIIQVVARIVARMVAKLRKVFTRPLIAYRLITVKSIGTHPASEASAIAAEHRFIPNKPTLKRLGSCLRIIRIIPRMHRSRRTCRNLKLVSIRKQLLINCHNYIVIAKSAFLLITSITVSILISVRPLPNRISTISAIPRNCLSCRQPGIRIPLTRIIYALVICY